MPMRSAYSICSSACWISCCSESAAHGRASWCSWKTPDFMGSAPGSSCGCLGGEGVEALEDLGATRVRGECVLELGGGGLHEVLAVRAGRLGERGVPQRPDDLGTWELAARRADERAVAHLGERGAEIVDVRCLVGAHVAHQRGRFA